jgi:acyl-CoA thioesterase
VHLRARVPLESDWVLGRFATRTARDGLLEEDCELWSRDGLLLAQSRQLALALSGS